MPTLFRNSVSAGAPFAGGTASRLVYGDGNGTLQSATVLQHDGINLILTGSGYISVKHGTADSEVFGASAGNALTTGIRNALFGNSAGANLTVNAGITAVGYGAATNLRVFSSTFTADASTDIGTLATDPTASHSIRTGTLLALTTTGVLPAGLVATMYAIAQASSAELKFATTYANAIAGTAVDVTDTGTGVHTVTHTPGDATVVGRGADGGRYGGFSTLVGSFATNSRYNNVIALGYSATASDNGQFVLATSANPLRTSASAGAISTYMHVRVNSTEYRMALYATS